MAAPNRNARFRKGFNVPYRGVFGPVDGRVIERDPFSPSRNGGSVNGGSTPESPGVHEIGDCEPIKSDFREIILCRCTKTQVNIGASYLSGFTIVNLIHEISYMKRDLRR